jgi:hypothetical protein
MASVRINRREWLAYTALGTLAPFGGVRCLASQASDPAERAARIARVIGEYAEQGFHRTGTAVDQASADWLSGQVAQAGLVPAQEPFSLSRIDPIACAVTIDGRRVEGIPLFDGAFTDESGVRGRLGVAGANTEIALVDTNVNAASAGPLGAARRANTHRAIVAITRGRTPGLSPSNADGFLEPFGPPVLQVPSEEAGWLAEQAQRGAEAHLVAHVARTPAVAHNVTTSIAGSSPELPPFVVMTPRSGWYWCASERGGGIAAWLEIMRELRTRRPARTLLFVASSGHELGHLGIDAFIARRPGIVKSTAGWLHLGANIGAATDPSITLQASDEEMDAALTRALKGFGLTVTRRTARGAVPGGEAEAVHHGGGRYVSVIGGNRLFHHQADRGVEAVAPVAIANFSAAFVALVEEMARNGSRL